MSFSADTEDLHDDGFEGSHDEHGIFTKVFFENGGGSTSKRCPVAGVDNFECKHSKKLDTSLCSNSANSAVTSWSCSKNLCQEDTNAVIESYGGACASGSFLDRNALAERDDLDASVKRIKFSAAEVSRDKAERRMVLHAPLQQNEIVSGLYSKSLGSVYQKVTPDLIESSAQGFTSSGHLLKQYVKGGRGTKTKDKDITKSRIQDLDASDRKEAVIGKAIASPVSQESFASKLVVSSPAAVVEKFESPFSVEEQLSGFQSSGVGSSDISGVIDSKKDPRPLLQTHVFRILRSAGWSIERRKRSCRTYVETVYRSPEGRLFREFPNVWRYFGQVLFSDSCNFVLDNDGKKWTDMSQFWSDLLDTLANIEKELNQPNVSYTLAHYWAILDPFVNVIFVNRKIGSLRKGAEVKAGSSLATQINKKNGVVLARRKNVTKEKFCSQGHMSTQLHDSSLAAESSLTASERSYNTCNGLSGNGSLSRAVRRLKGVRVPQADQVSMCLEDTANRPETFDCKVKGQRIASSYACGSDSTHGQLGNFKYIDFVASGDVSDILQGSVSAAPYQYSNISSPSSNKQRSECNVKTPSELPGDLSFESLEENDKSSGAQDTGKVGKLPQHLLDGHPSYLSDGLLQSGCDGYQFDKLTDALKFETKDEGSALGVILKKKACRRSRKISEIRLTALNQSGFLWSYPPGMNDHRDIDVCQAELNSKEAQESFVTKGNLRKSSSLGSCLHQVKKKGSKFKRSFGTRDGSKNRQKKSTECQIQDDDLLSKKSRCKLLPRSIGKGGKHITEIKLYNIGSRTVLSWLILAGVISLNDVIQYRDPEDDSIVKDGLVSWDGIVCNCCNRVLSVSEFKTHAGFKFNRPCMNLFMESGKPFTLCQLQAWSAEYKTRKNGIQKVEADDNDQNDDSCGLCGDVGELICCDNCPSTFHLSCLFMKLPKAILGKISFLVANVPYGKLASELELPEGNWYCSNCTCPICGNFVNDKDASSSFDSFKCSQCEHKSFSERKKKEDGIVISIVEHNIENLHHKACLNDKSGLEEKVSDTLFCGGSCKELHLGLSSRLGMINHLSNGFSWTLLRCIHEDQKIHSAQRLALKAECNSKLAVALSIMEECFLSMVDPRTGVDMRPHLMYNWGSEFARLNFSGFYSLVLEKEDVVICVASIRIHGVTVAEMPLIATCSKYRRQGMCRSLVNVIEELLISFKVEKLVITAIPNVVETWTKGFGFKLVEEEEREALNKINLMVFPGTVLLSKPLYQSQKTDVQSETGNTSCLQQDNSIEHLRREELTNVGIQAVGDQLADSLQHTIYAKEACAKIVTEFVGDKTLQESEINGTKEIANAGGEELCDNLALRVIEETTRLVICTKGKSADESVQCADCNFLSEEVRIKLEERPKVRSCQEYPAGETNSVSQTDGCCGDNEADTVVKVESVQQSDPVCVNNHSAKIDEGVVVTPEQFLEVSCEEQEMALASSSVKKSCICNGTQVSVGETAAERL
ncbi:hypothetical protein Golob_018474 [Gossypium lobatum]|uniref:N-acetyltransferase domain-containing protein n=1 Tax=Gossypium lobatum TaxID=34289 RepID=A0A7J8MAC3_9ROSI|nr:hypothetical protein [Gossypium lobatum]